MASHPSRPNRINLIEQHSLFAKAPRTCTNCTRYSDAPKGLDSKTSVALDFRRVESLGLPQACNPGPILHVPSAHKVGHSCRDGTFQEFVASKVHYH